MIFLNDYSQLFTTFLCSFLAGDEGELTYTIKQRDICNAVDLASASKVNLLFIFVFAFSEEKLDLYSVGFFPKFFSVGTEGFCKINVS